MNDSRTERAFAADARRWSENGEEASLLRLFRSPHSGVSHDIAAAYATLAERTGSLLDTIAGDLLALPSLERDAVFAFAERARTRDAKLFVPQTARRSRAKQARSFPLDLAQPAKPEAHGIVRARRPHFSASALNTYVECERKWFYRYVCAAVEDRGSAASAYGTAFHLALERFHVRYSQPQPSEAAAMLHDIEREIDAAFKELRSGFPTAVEFELQLRRARRTARRYVAWLSAEAARAPFTVIGRELPTQLELEGFAFIGFIDRLDRDERGSTRIVDYKTGTIAASAAEYREKVERFGDFQLPFYYWARTAEGDRVTNLALLPLKDALLDVRPVVLEVVPVPTPPTTKRDASIGTIPISELERAKTRMIEICRELTAEQPRTFDVTRDPDSCVFCAYVNACARRPPADGERFGR